MRLLLQHHSHYGYPRPASLGAQLVRLRPANHVRARVESYGLRIKQESTLRWQQDPYGNHVARVTFAPDARLTELDVLVEMALDIRPLNPFDFLLDELAQTLPFAYPAPTAAELAPFLVRSSPGLEQGPLFTAFDAELPRAGTTLEVLTEINQRVNRRVRYVVRDEPGVWSPEQTLEEGRASCRDSALLLVALLRARGIAARFVSGYLIQLADEGMIPDQPRGVSRDVVDLHAWAEAYLPGAGWIGFDATSGLLCGEGHIPLASAASPALAAPIEGTTDVLADRISFQLTLGRLGHEPRPTAPFTDEVYAELLTRADAADARLTAEGLVLTSGGEPTFNSREHVKEPEWNGAALGASKWSQGLALAGALRERLLPGAALIIGQGKHYPGESLPRWTLDLVAREDGAPLWTGTFDAAGAAKEPGARGLGPKEGRVFLEALGKRLGLAQAPLELFEDPWAGVTLEARLPVDVDPLEANLTDPEERRRLAQQLDRGLGAVVGYVLPLARYRGAWVSDTWKVRRQHLFLLSGDAPVGQRLPLSTLPSPAELEEADREDVPLRAPGTRSKPPPAGKTRALRTAVTVDVREGTLRVFLPPLPAGADFVELVGHVDAVRRETGWPVELEGYGPPRSAHLRKLAVTPDPGVLEVNLPPARSSREHVQLLATSFDAALHVGLHSEKYLVDGRIAGSGGGHHLTLGGPTVKQSPLLVRPAILASLITLFQHHPSLSYLFTGLFVGPTSQAPRVDEARHDALYELELALARAFDGEPEETPPELLDGLFRHLLVDVAGNTHRAELCIDKLYDWRTPHGRQGLLELRAFEMPAHPRLAAAQAVLVRTLVAAVAKVPYRGPLLRWGMALHDRFLLPYYLWRDFEEVLALLEERGVPLPAEAYRPFLELRCPVAGRLEASGVTLEVRNALEPWHVLGEEATGAGTSRFVDSSVERVQVRVEGFTPGRHLLLVNGLEVPLHATGMAGEYVAGVKFRAWAPPHTLQPHLGIHHPLRFDVLDTWGQRSLGACGYHVWHAEGRAFDVPPLTRFEAEARRSQRFTREAPLPWPVTPKRTTAAAETPYTLDLRRFSGDRPVPIVPDPDEMDSSGP